MSYRCGDFHLDPANRKFTRGSAVIALEPKTLAVLVRLVSRAGTLVTREEILDAVWGHRHVTPSALNRRIALARRAFDDDADEPKYIQTVHGAGYRYIGPLERQDPALSRQSLPFAAALCARLPARIESLIGREHDLVTLAELLRSHRALTVVGPGGMGKTQCALECARNLAADFPDGVWFFDLAPLQKGAEWLHALAAALAIPLSETPELLSKTLPVLRSRRALLLLDNCDRMADEMGALVSGLLRGTEALQVLATSQKPLNFAGEQLMWLPSLALPRDTARGGSELRDVETAPAVQMLLNRIRAAQPHFNLTASNAPTVAEICRRLDGMPLALELAATRFALLSPEQILQRLDHRFRFLQSDTAGRDPRHRNLLAMLDWSYSLLSGEEQQLLSWLSAFLQGWTMDAAVHLAGSLGHDAEKVLELLGGLVSKSLVSVTPGLGAPRYHLLETVREYGLQRLRVSGEEVRARDAHLAYVTHMCAQAHRDMVAGSMRERVAALAYEHGSISGALEHAARSETTRPMGLAIVGALTLYIKARGPLDVGQKWCRLALTGTEMLDCSERARALLCQGITAAHLRDGRESPEACLREAARLARSHDDLWTEAYASAYWSMWQANSGHTAAAAEALTVTQDIAERLDDPLLRGLAGLARGWIHMTNGDGSTAVETLSGVCQLSADEHQRHFIRVYLGLALIGLGRHVNAAAVLSEAIDTIIELRNVRGAAGCVECCGYICEKLGHGQDGARLLGAARAIRERTEVPLFNFWLPYHHAAHVALEAQLGAEEYAACSRDGAAMREEDAINAAALRLKSFGAGADQGPARR
ncbi:MAG TPA: winged helix-turn-helix domain-containing protein [Steroidobacteraceae bacterium]|nr:winged helix-turn-helix domain-containing protein [Steroidobacteraceae bacterium]